MDANSKIEICNSCEKYNLKLKLCKVCKCFMPAKVLLPLVKCPEGKW